MHQVVKETDEPLPSQLETGLVEEIPEIEITNCESKTTKEAEVEVEAEAEANNEAERIPAKGDDHSKIRRKFDSVRNLLEKARQKLLLTRC